MTAGSFVWNTHIAVGALGAVEDLEIEVKVRAKLKRPITGPVDIPLKALSIAEPFKKE